MQRFTPCVHYDKPIALKERKKILDIFIDFRYICTFRRAQIMRFHIKIWGKRITGVVCWLCGKHEREVYIIHLYDVIARVTQMFSVSWVSVYPKFDHFSKNYFLLFQTDLIAIFHLKKKFYVKRLILSKIINIKRFFPLIISNWLLSTRCHEK